MFLPCTGAHIGMYHRHSVFVATAGALAFRLRNADLIIISNITILIFEFIPPLDHLGLHHDSRLHHHCRLSMGTTVVLVSIFTTHTHTHKNAHTRTSHVLALPPLKQRFLHLDSVRSVHQNSGFFSLFSECASVMQRTELGITIPSRSQPPRTFLPLT